MNGTILWSDIGIHGILNVDSLLRDDLLYGFNFAPIQTHQTLHGIRTDVCFILFTLLLLLLLISLFF